RTLVEIDKRYFRPTEVDLLIGDPTKARTRLGWTATVTLEEMIKEMVSEDLKALQRQPATNKSHD
ncbi:MAG: GDP-mannose 4,6-dehydratase, partial [Hyphomicrobiaceae bacterium]|nr:GDP-mannose 4,6-dehydratase [Hyphomicrobiaceae bacterium]